MTTIDTESLWLHHRAEFGFAFVQIKRGEFTQKIADQEYRAVRDAIGQFLDSAGNFHLFERRCSAALESPGPNRSCA